VRSAAAWLLGTALFAVGMVLADRLFWSQCSGLAAQRYAEVWICANAPLVRIAVAGLAGLAAGLLVPRRALMVGALAGLAGVAAVSLAYRPLLAFNQVHAVLNAIVYFILPTMLGCALAARVRGASFPDTRRR
jgi:hypothetical protein